MRRSNWLMFLLLLIAAFALTACASANAGFEPGLLENELAGEPAADRQEPEAQETMTLASLVQDLDSELNSAEYVAPGDCTYGTGYWKNHPENWEVESLTLGDETYTADALRSILNTPPRGDATYILAQQLIAAKLNGAEGEVADAIATADAWLAANALESAPADEARQDGILLAEFLDDYNNGYLGLEACDDQDGDDDDLDDEDDDELDDDDDERVVDEDGECTGADPHPHATTLAEDYDVTYEEIMDKFCDGYGFGEIELAYLLAEEAGMDVAEIYALRDAGMGWGNIRKEVGAEPGLGNDKPKPNEDGELPPGQEKKEDGEVPPGQEKKSGEWTPPGQEKQSERDTPPGKAKKDK